MRSRRSKLTVAMVFLALTLLVCMSQAELRFVVQFNRHGARGPFPTIIDSPGWKQSQQLTPNGMRQLFMFGSELRRRYVKELQFLPEQFEPSVFFIRSTYLNRTIQSAQSLYLGLYPPGTGPSLDWNYPQNKAIPPGNGPFDFSNLQLEALPKLFQSIPIHTKGYREFEMLSWAREVCPATVRRFEERMKTDRFKKLEDEFRPMFKKLSAALGVPVEKINLKTANDVYDTLLMDHYEGMKLRLPYRGELWNSLAALYNVSQLLKDFDTRAEINWATTKQYQEMVALMDDVVADRSRFKWATFSCHDVNINLLLVSLNITSGDCVLQKHRDRITEPDEKCPFPAQIASNILFELHENDGKWTVRFFYEDQQYPLAGVRNLEYSKFRQILVDSYDPDFFGKCFEPVLPEGEPSNEGWGVLHVLLFIVLVLLAIALLSLVFVTLSKLGGAQKTSLPH